MEMEGGAMVDCEGVVSLGFVSKSFNWVGRLAERLVVLEVGIIREEFCSGGGMLIINLTLW